MSAVLTNPIPPAQQESPGLWTLAWRRLRQDPVGMFSLAVVALFVKFAVKLLLLPLLLVKWLVMSVVMLVVGPILFVVGVILTVVFGLVIAVPLTAILRELFWYLDARLRGLPAVEAFASTRVAYGVATAASSPQLDAAMADEGPPR